MREWAVRLGIGEYQTVPKHPSPNWPTQQKNSSKRIITLFFIITRTIKEDLNRVRCPLNLWHCFRLESVQRGLFLFCFFNHSGAELSFQLSKISAPSSDWVWPPGCGVSVYHSNCIKSFHYESMWSEFLWHKMGRADNWEWNQCEIVFQLGWSVWSISDRDHSPYQVIILVWSCDCFSSQPDSISACIMQQLLIMSHFSLLQLGWPAPTRLWYIHQQVQDSSWIAPPHPPPLPTHLFFFRVSICSMLKRYQCFTWLLNGMFIIHDYQLS